MSIDRKKGFSPENLEGVLAQLSSSQTLHLQMVLKLSDEDLSTLFQDYRNLYQVLKGISSGKIAQDSYFYKKILRAIAFNFGMSDGFDTKRFFEMITDSEDPDFKGFGKYFKSLETRGAITLIFRELAYDIPKAERFLILQGVNPFPEISLITKNLNSLDMTKSLEEQDILARQSNMSRLPSEILVETLYAMERLNNRDMQLLIKDITVLVKILGLIKSGHIVSGKHAESDLYDSVINAMIDNIEKEVERYKKHDQAEFGSYDHIFGEIQEYFIKDLEKLTGNKRIDDVLEGVLMDCAGSSKIVREYLFYRNKQTFSAAERGRISSFLRG